MAARCRGAVVLACIFLAHAACVHAGRAARPAARLAGQGDVLAPAAASKCAAVTWAQPPRGAPPAPVRLSGNQFVTADGTPVSMHAINYFGFNNRMTFLNGLWAGGSSSQSDFAAIVYQLKLLGFGAVRLPFLFEDLRTPAVVPIGGYCTQQSTLAEMANRTIDPLVSRASIRKAAPPPLVPLPNVSEPGSCNHYIPPAKAGPTMERFLWTVQWLVANGMYVLIDWHPMGMEQSSYNVAEFVREWTHVWSQVTCLPNYKRDLEGRVMIDLFNEPDSQWQGWQPVNGKAGMTELYLSALDALWAISPSPSTIFVINGGGQGNYSGLNWGNGFVTDRAIIAEYGISDANPFFTALMSKPYLNNVVISPHIYGPSVSHRKDFYAGKEWMDSLDKAFGYLNKQGYCLGKKCHVFPVWVGEFGSKFQEPEDLRHLKDLATYLNSDTPGHAPVRNWAYWCYNANSGDTGGIVDDSWHNLEWTKLRWLTANLGLKPWWMSVSASAETPQQLAAGEPAAAAKAAEPVAAVPRLLPRPAAYEPAPAAKALGPSSDAWQPPSSAEELAEQLSKGVL